MITEGFVNTCFKILLSADLPFKGSAALFRDIYSILDSVKNKNNYEVPLSLKNKFDILFLISQMRLEGKDPDLILDSLSLNKSAKDYLDFLYYNRNLKITKKEADSYATQILMRKKLSLLLSNYDSLTIFLDQINSGTYENLDTAIHEYELLVREMFAGLSTIDKHKAIECGQSIDMLNDEFDSLSERILESNSHQNVIPTGFNIFDNQIMHGGFEPPRLYLIAGGSGSGKSTLILNFLKNAITRNNPDTKETSNYLYISLENTLEESFLRFYQALRKCTTQEALEHIKNGLDIKEYIKNHLLKSNSNIIMKYFPAGTTSAIDIASTIDDIQSQTNQKVKGVFVDYLDLLKSDRPYSERRHELGYITLSLKVLAVDYFVPVITPTQLNRAIYSVKHAGELNLNMMGESIQKVEHADFVLLSALDQTNPQIVHSKVAKFRNGKSGSCLQFNVDFDKFLFKTCTYENNVDSQVDPSMLLKNSKLKFDF